MSKCNMLSGHARPESADSAPRSTKQEVRDLIIWIRIACGGVQFRDVGGYTMDRDDSVRR